MSGQHDALHKAHELARQANLAVTVRRGQSGRVHAYRVWRLAGTERRTFVGERGSPEAVLALVKRAAGSTGGPPR